MDQPKSAKEIKKDKIEAIVGKIAKAKSLTFADYRGLTANQLAQLRNQIRATGAEILIEKNSLLKRALISKNISVSNEQLAGPTATIFAFEDEIAPIKEITQTAKTLGVPSFKFGYLENQLLDASQLEVLASIPGKDQLRANLVGSISSPLYGLVSTLEANIRNLIYALVQKAKIQGVSESGSSV